MAVRVSGITINLWISAALSVLTKRNSVGRWKDVLVRHEKHNSSLQLRYSMGTLPFPLFLSFGAGTPATTDVDKMIVAGAEDQVRIHWDNGDPTSSGVYEVKLRSATLIKILQ